jgi:hypothetical protein
MKHLINDIDKLFEELIHEHKPIKHYINTTKKLIDKINERKINITSDSIDTKYCILAITETIANFNIYRTLIKQGRVSVTKEEYYNYINNINKLREILFSICNLIVEKATADELNKNNNEVIINDICKKYNITKEELKNLL